MVLNALSSVYNMMQHYGLEHLTVSFCFDLLPLCFHRNVNLDHYDTYDKGSMYDLNYIHIQIASSLK